MAKAVGLDIGARHVKVCELEGSAKKFRMSRFAIREFALKDDGSPDEESLVEAIRKVFREERFPRDSVVVALDAQDCILRDLSVPFKGDDQIAKVVKFETEGHLHSCSIDEVVVDYYKTGEIGNRSKLLVFAAQKKPLGHLLDVLRKADIEPTMVDLDVVALFSAMSASGRLQAHKTVVGIDIGARTTSLFVAEFGALRLVRAVRVGADALTAAIRRDLDVSFENAEDKKLKSMAAAGTGVAQDLLVLEEDDDVPAPKRETEKSADELERDLMTHRREEFFDRIGREVSRSLATLKLEQPIEAIVVTGGGSRVSGMREALERVLGVPVEEDDLLAHVPHALPTAISQDAGVLAPVAAGLALKQLGFDPVGIDFRQDEFRYQKTFDQIRVVLACTVSLIAILLLVVLASKLDELRRAKKPFADLVGRYRDETAKVLPKESFEESSLDVASYMNLAVDSKNKELQKKLGKGGDYPDIRSALTNWNEMSKALQHVYSQIQGFTLDSITIDQSAITLMGTVPSPEMLEKMKAELLKNPAFLAVETGGTDPDPRGSGFIFQRFKIKLEEEKH
ncbi:MAG: pilus assembly protein PilM [Planctomycetes bacterium]|nr:pilus assembly protein PilM [Planctomycetota bacterium]MBI3846286.1 pilus assembly protein PilM [Planctomycetota bacterium]